MEARRTISRSDLDAGRVEFGDLDTGELLPPVHPEAVLRHDFIEPLGLSAHALALALRVPANRITTILAGERAVTAETALRLARHFGTGPGFWLNPQKNYELEVARRASGDRIRMEVSPRAQSPQDKGPQEAGVGPSRPGKTGP